MISFINEPKKINFNNEYEYTWESEDSYYFNFSKYYPEIEEDFVNDQDDQDSKTNFKIFFTVLLSSLSLYFLN
jgi:hypothetical protein